MRGRRRVGLLDGEAGIEPHADAGDEPCILGVVIAVCVCVAGESDRVECIIGRRLDRAGVDFQLADPQDLCGAIGGILGDGADQADEIDATTL